MTIDPITAGLIGFLFGMTVGHFWTKEDLSDPVYQCEVYKKQGCAHVDGILCDFPQCTILAEFRMNNNGCAYKTGEE